MSVEIVQVMPNRREVTKAKREGALTISKKLPRGKYRIVFKGLGGMYDNSSPVVEVR